MEQLTLTLFSVFLLFFELLAKPSLEQLRRGDRVVMIVREKRLQGRYFQP
jgi:hypothetical protein